VTERLSPTTKWPTARFVDGQRVDGEDVLATEGPVEFRISGVPIAVLMRTPGRDESLAAGFLITEGIVLGPDEIDSVVPVDGSSEGDRYDVILAPGVVVDPEQFRRNVYASSSCGVCGKASIDAVLVASRKPPEGPVVTPRFIAGLPDRMRSVQDQFELTGSVHAAAVFDSTGELIVSAEDVGRHNAVDKVVGELAPIQWPIGEVVLVVSGRIGFEIVQKAAVAGIPVICGISGASSLAASLGEETGVTVIGFLRGDSFSVYSGSHRIGS
jgi:FdhD protein